ncbi:hypothetical protein J2W22_000964 [Sphingomonas kyeonggiensis]|nr:hypothetical protein [Sphingomonas kyeonggiensis]
MPGDAKSPFRLREGLGEGVCLAPVASLEDIPSPDPSRKRKGSADGGRVP